MDGEGTSLWKFAGIKSAPTEMYYIGDIGICNEKAVAVIGRRDPDERIYRVAVEYGRSLAEQGYVVVNGLALGCDTGAICGALEVRGKVIAVLPCGLDEIYPKTNEGLAREIVDSGGCLISEYAKGVRPEKYMFVQRDRIQALLADKVLVVDAKMDSGTMKTVDYALKYGKPVACHEDARFDVSGGMPFLVEMGRARGISDMAGLMAFLQLPVFRQMSLFDIDGDGRSGDG